MMYMTGGGIQIFSVMSVYFLLKQAVSGILSVEKGALLLQLSPTELTGPPPQRSLASSRRFSHSLRPLSSFQLARPSPSSRRRSSPKRPSLSRANSRSSASDCGSATRWDYSQTSGVTGRAFSTERKSIAGG